MKEIKIGLIGFGTIGTGVAKLLQANAGLIADKVGAAVTLKKIADLDITTDRGIELPPGTLTSNVAEVLDDPEISVVIELIGGYEPAKSFVLRAINNGKHVVTANKALLALHGEEIIRRPRPRGSKSSSKRRSAAASRSSRPSWGTWRRTTSPRCSAFSTAHATTSSPA